MKHLIHRSNMWVYDGTRSRSGEKDNDKTAFRLQSFQKGQLISQGDFGKKFSKVYRLVPNVWRSTCNWAVEGGGVLHSIQELWVSVPTRTSFYHPAKAGMSAHRGIQHVTSSPLSYLSSLPPNFTLLFKLVEEGEKPKAGENREDDHTSLFYLLMQLICAKLRNFYFK